MLKIIDAIRTINRKEAAEANNPHQMPLVHLTVIFFLKDQDVTSFSALFLYHLSLRFLNNSMSMI